MIWKLLIALLVGYLGWRLWHGVGRRMPGTPIPPPPPAADPLREARALLGVAPGASADEVRAAHRRLIARVHPDRGGTAELAQRINEARDALLNGD